MQTSSSKTALFWKLPQPRVDKLQTLSHVQALESSVGPEEGLCFGLVVGRQGDHGNFALLAKHRFVYFEGKRKNVRYPDNLYSILASAGRVSKKYWTAANLPEHRKQTLSRHWYFCRAGWTVISWVRVSSNTEIPIVPCFLATLRSFYRHRPFQPQLLEQHRLLISDLSIVF